MRACSASEVTSRGLNSLMNEGTSTRASCTTSPSSPGCAASPGLTWSERRLWPKMSFHYCMSQNDPLHFPTTGLEVPELLLLLGDALTRRVPNLTPLHRCQLSRYLGDVCVGRRQLLQAVVGGGACVPATQGHLEVQLPPMPLPLAQGTTLEELERRLGHKERQLCALREGSGVTLEVDDPEVGLLDREGVIKLVRAAVRTSGEKLAAVLHQEATMIAELLELKMQCTASATRGSLNPTSPKAPPQEKAGRPGKMTACQRVSKHNGAQPRRTARP